MRNLVFRAIFFFALVQSTVFIIQTYRLFDAETSEEIPFLPDARNGKRKLRSKDDASLDPNKTPPVSLERPFHGVDTKGQRHVDPKNKPVKATRLPYYLYGKHDLLKLSPHVEQNALIENIVKEKHKAINDPNVSTWVLPMPMIHPMRNHDSVILEGDGHRPIMVTLLGRYSRYIQSINLITGKQSTRRTKGKDPSGNPIDDLNHVFAVVVDSLNHQGQEIWLPCGFHNDAVHTEMSTDYVRIVNASTLKVRVGPKLPIAAGACNAKALSIIPNEPSMICTFAGTQGCHDNGTLLKYTQCYDRLREKWWTPFGNLPYGLDHGSIAFVPAGTCHRDDPARVLLFNFRTRRGHHSFPYPHTEFLAHDIPKDGWKVDKLRKNGVKPPQKWYLYHNVTDTSNFKDVPRDASGVVTANNGRFILNFGGTFRHKEPVMHNGILTKKGRTSMIRSFDVCRKEWSVVGDLSFQTFGVQTAASDQLNVAVSCGGQAALKHSNSPFCFVSRWNNMTVSNPQSSVRDASSTQNAIMVE